MAHCEYCGHNGIETEATAETSDMLFGGEILTEGDRMTSLCADCHEQMQHYPRVTREEIAALRDEAEKAGDTAQIELCDASDWEDEAFIKCAEAILAARAGED